MLELLSEITTGVISGIASGGGSLFLALISLMVRLIYRKIKGSRYRALKMSLNLLGTKIDAKNKEGNERLREKIEAMARDISQMAQELKGE